MDGEVWIVFRSLQLFLPWFLLKEQRLTREFYAVLPARM